MVSARGLESFDIMKNNDCRFILGFGISGYRSFGPELQRIGPCQKINFFVGQNNCGKSNILRFIHERYAQLNSVAQGQHEWRLTNLEAHVSAQGFTPKLSLALSVPKSRLKEWTKDHSSQGREMGRHFDALLETISIDKCDSGFWVDAIVSKSGEGNISNEFLERLSKISGFVDICRDINHACRGHSPSGDQKAIVREAVKWLLREMDAQGQRIVMVPCIRRPGTADRSDSDLSGSDIIHRVAQLQNPDHDKQQMRTDFERIQKFLCEVTDRPDARLEVPYNRKTLVVHMDGRSMPLEALGTGIHEVIILAATATVLHESVICIEEPELHLHPLLQKKLLRHLDEQTDNQYFIGTHSAHMLDHAGAAIFHVRLNEGSSVVTPATEAIQRFAICSDLGYRASDLLQTNCVIWVEGPSDRIYVREWIRLCDPKLAEGIDYTIMFYGGRLLSHLSPNDPDIKGFISLRQMNRNMAIVMDSDKSSEADLLNPTKSRILNDWGAHSGFAWVTAGREAENYVAPDVILEALNSVASRKQHEKPLTIFARCIPIDTNGTPAADKVKVAKWLEENRKLTLDQSDLRSQMERLCNFIRAANHAERAKTSGE